MLQLCLHSPSLSVKGDAGRKRWCCIAQSHLKSTRRCSALPGPHSWSHTSVSCGYHKGLPWPAASSYTQLQRPELGNQAVDRTLRKPVSHQLPDSTWLAPTFIPPLFNFCRILYYVFQKILAIRFRVHPNNQHTLISRSLS